jgi:hypothetical protein
LISKSPALYKLLAWAEAQDQQQIEIGHVMTAAGNCAPQGDIELLNIALWGFLATCTNGTAETVFNSGAKLNGLEGWRRLCRHIDWGAGIYLDDCRTAVRHVTLKPMRRLEDVAVGVLEFEEIHKRYVQAGGAMPPDGELKSDLLAIVPNEIREHLLLRSTDLSVNFTQFKDFIVQQTARLLVNRRKSPMVNIVDGHPAMMTNYDQNSGHDQTYEEVEYQDDAGDMTKEDLQDLLVFAQQQGYKGRGKGFGKGSGAQRPRFPPRAGATRPGQMGAPQREMRCVNCGRAGHAVADCRSPIVPVSERATVPASARSNHLLLRRGALAWSTIAPNIRSGATW